MAELDYHSPMQLAEEGVSFDVIRNSATKSLKWTLFGMRLAGIFLRIGAIFFLLAAALLFWIATNTKHGIIFLVILPIGLFCTLGSCLSCYGAGKLSFYRMAIQRLDSTVDRGISVIDAVRGRGEGGPQALSDIAVSEARHFVGPRASHVLDALGSRTGTVRTLIGSAGLRVREVIGRAGGRNKVVKDVTTKVNVVAMRHVDHVAKSLEQTSERLTERAIQEAKHYAHRGMMEMKEDGIGAEGGESKLVFHDALEEQV